MTRGAGLALLGGLLGVAVLAATLAAPIPQNPVYHRMADGRAIAGIPNAFNVVSNLALVLIGVLGLWSLAPGRPGAAGRFVEAREGWPYRVFFAGLVLTGLGSAYYHVAPTDERLVWDRLPLAITLMGLFAATIVERIGVSTGLLLLGPLMALGIWSVLEWYAGERRGAGDLRFYAVVQFYPMLAIPLMVLLLQARYTRGEDLLIMVGCYAAAKAFELLDREIFSLGGVVSGHTLKHLAAALSGYWVWRMLIKRQPA